MKSKINWPFQPLYTLDIVIGCVRNCYNGECWAKKTNERIKKVNESSDKDFNGWVNNFNNIQYFPDIWNKIYKIPEHSYIFVGSRSDICFWDEKFFKDTVKKCKGYKNYTFVFLTKDPAVYNLCDYGSNIMLGLTIESKKQIKTLQLFEKIIRLKKTYSFLSIEPLLGSFEGANFNAFDLLIVGAMSGKNKTVPKKEWINSIKFHNVWFKKNIQKHL